MITSARASAFTTLAVLFLLAAAVSRALKFYF